jgi:outer membrane receptor protein involved in Fe transport
MAMKRDAQGVVDGIVAEDIGKFPDTNLAESLQRIPGVSIDRSIGEGSKVTVRGLGPDFNLVLLNGRQMPGSSIQDTGASDSRSFDFAEPGLGSRRGPRGTEDRALGDAHRRAIGATVNIKTTRPLDAPGMHLSLGMKGVSDTSSQNLPDHLQGDSWTPEFSGIFSDTFAEERVGVSLTASYQKRRPPATTRPRSATAGARSPATRTTGARLRSRGSRVRRTSPTGRIPPTPTRCRKTWATASTASSVRAPMAS